MPLNLILNPWFPVRDVHGGRRIIAPWEIADSDLAAPDWPRPDLNIAAYEFLIGLIAMADPPRDKEDWRARRAPDPERLRMRLAAYASAFNLVGEGPLFMQDFEELEGEAKSPDLLFIDSAGANTIKNNADLAIMRDRYPRLDPPLAAMALFTLQAHAPTGGAGNRTSMRGGGPLVTLVDPGHGLWDMVWANTPYGEPAMIEHLPWMRPTRISSEGEKTTPDDVPPIEALFGMPRRLRLIAESGVAGAVIGIIQRPHGTNYTGWRHPLTPYYKMKADTEWLPLHPKAGGFSYRNYLGVTAAQPGNGLRARAEIFDLWDGRSNEKAQTLVGGWAMDNAKPRDFVFSRTPLFNAEDERLSMLSGLASAGDQASLALRNALEVILGDGEGREMERETFYAETAAPFQEAILALLSGADPEDVAQEWLLTIRKVALVRFDLRALPALNARRAKGSAKIIETRGFLEIALKGYGKYGKAIYGGLGMEIPTSKKDIKKKEEEA